MKRGKIIFLYFLIISGAFYFYSAEFSRSATTVNIPTFKYDGRMSHFGGPGDINQTARSTAGNLHEGLAYYNFKNMSSAPQGLFLSKNDPRIVSLEKSATDAGTTLGAARYLNPDSYYVAMRFPRGVKVPEKVVITSGDKSVVCQVVDWGPADYTKRDVDLSPGAEKALGLQTNQKVSSVVVADKNAKLGPTNSTPIKTETSKPVTQTTPKTTTAPTTKIISTTNTQTSSGGNMWVTAPYCYKHMGPASPSELKTAMTCNGGFFYWYDDDGRHEYFVDDCGINGSACNSAASWQDGATDGPMAGCLNYKCKNKPNSIWDPQSKKCGCG